MKYLSLLLLFPLSGIAQCPAAKLYQFYTYQLDGRRQPANCWIPILEYNKNTKEYVMSIHSKRPDHVYYYYLGTMSDNHGIAYTILTNDITHAIVLTDTCVLKDLYCDLVARKIEEQTADSIVTARYAHQWDFKPLNSKQ